MNATRSHNRIDSFIDSKFRGVILEGYLSQFGQMTHEKKRRLRA